MNPIEASYYKRIVMLWVIGLSFLVSQMIFLSNLIFTLLLSPRKTLTK
jgi:hypothetical protein